MRNNIYKYAVLFLFVSVILSCTRFFYGKKPGLLASVQQEPKHYVIIGCSATGYHAARELTNLEKAARVTCISDETVYPYKKTSLKSFVSGTKSEEQISLIKPSDENTINFLMGTKVVDINRQSKTVTLRNGDIINYDKLLIATGAEPQIPMHLAHALEYKGVYFYNSKKDVDEMLTLVAGRKQPKALIVGAGIRSLELADALKRRNSSIKIVLVNRSAHFLGMSSDDTMDAFIKSRLQSHGIEFLAPMGIQKITTTKKNALVAWLDQGQIIESDLIIFAMGTLPNSELAQKAGLELYDNLALKVDAELRTNDAYIFAAGDVTSFKNPIGLGEIRSNKWRDAKKQGIIAAQNMAGQHQRYEHQSNVHISSFFGLKALISGDLRMSLKESSVIKASRDYYYRFMIQNDQLKAFALIWDRKQKSPNIFWLRKKLIQQSPVKPEDF